MANHVPTGAAGGALRGGMLGGVLGFLTIPALVAGTAALIAATTVAAPAAAGAGIVWGTVATYTAIAGIATTVLNTIIPSPFNNLAMAAYGAAGFGLFGAAGGASKGMQENVQDQARGAYINAYAQTRAGLDQMQAQAYMQEAPIMAANQNEAAYSQRLETGNAVMDAATIAQMGQGVQSTELAAANEQGR